MLRRNAGATNNNIFKVGKIKLQIGNLDDGVKPCSGGEENANFLFLQNLGIMNRKANRRQAHNGTPHCKGQVDLVYQNVCTGNITGNDGAFAAESIKQRILQEACSSTVNTLVGMRNGFVDALGSTRGMDNDCSLFGFRRSVGDGSGLVLFQKFMHEQDSRHIPNLLVSHTDNHFLHRTIGQFFFIITNDNNITKAKLFFV